MKAKDFELKLNRNLAAAERAAGPLETLPCDCAGGFGSKAACHVRINGPGHMAKVVAALLKAEATGIDRMGFDPDGNFLHVDTENSRGRRRAWLIGGKNPDGADAIFSDDKERFRYLAREVKRHGDRLMSLEVDKDQIAVNGISMGRRTSPREPDPFFKRRQARAAAAAARLKAVKEFALTRGLSLAEAQALLQGKAA